MKSRWMTFLFSALTVAGCSSSERSVRKEPDAGPTVAQAPESGAAERSGSAGVARRAFEEARAGELAALRDEKEAKASVDSCDRRAAEIDRRVVGRRSERRGAEAVRAEHMESLDRQQRRREELLAKGASYAELRQAVDPDIAVANARVRSSDWMLATLDEEIALDELERAEALAARQCAAARIETAQQRLKVSRSLHSRAEEQASLAQSESGRP